MVNLPLFPELMGSDYFATYTTGILPSQHIQSLIDNCNLFASDGLESDQIQPASVDLRLGTAAFRVRASFLPNRSPVERRLRDLVFHELDLTRPTLLEAGSVYVIELMEELRLPTSLWAKANPKSTTGRLDILARLITDFSSEFDYVPTSYKGKLYLEVIPRTFSVVVRQGTRLNQLRFWRGRPPASDTLLAELHESEGIVYAESSDEPTDALISKGLWVHVDLSSSTGQPPIVGYRAKKSAPVIDLAKVAYYRPDDFWDPVFANDRHFIVLDANQFYILASRERIQVPPAVAAEMIGYEAKLGEFRVHYAGFFDPGFGYGMADARGTQAVFEVRSLGIPYVLEDGQRIARLQFERLQAVPDRVYGPEIGSSYQFQGLSLSKHFVQHSDRQTYLSAGRILTGASPRGA
jgi:dCTP deaminase